MKNSITKDSKGQAKKEYSKKHLIIIAACWIGLWHIFSMIVGSELLLPGPADAVKSLGMLVLTRRFYPDVFATIARCVFAMLISIVAGAVLSWCSFRVRFIRQLLVLPVSFFKAVPVMAIIIYVILLAKADWVAVIVCFFMCFPVVYTNLLSGLDATDVGFLELAKVCGLTKSETIRLIYLPGLLPQIKSAISLISGLSWKAVVAAEVLSIPAHSLGYQMLNSKYYLETSNLFAYVIVIVVLSLAFEKLIKGLMARLEWRTYEGSKLKSMYKTSSVAPTPIPTTVECRNLSKSFGEKTILDNFSMSFVAGKVTALMGPSGEGKTTLTRIIAGLESADSGSVKISKPGKTAVLFQEDRLLPWLNVYDNMALGLSGMSGEAVKNIASLLEIEEALYKLPAELSGGMKSRAAFGRTLLMDGSLIIFDEPFKGLDDALKKRIVDRLWASATKNKTVILVTHSKEDAELLADEIVVMQKQI